MRPRKKTINFPLWIMVILSTICLLVPWVVQPDDQPIYYGGQVVSAK